MVLMGIAFILLLRLYETVFGGSFLLSASANGLPIEAPPFVPFFTAVLGGNVVLTLPDEHLGPGDRDLRDRHDADLLEPSGAAWATTASPWNGLGDVNEKYHSPHWALLLWVVVGEAFLALFAFTICSDRSPGSWGSRSRSSS